MKDNFYEAQLRKTLKDDIDADCIKIIGDSSLFFDQLASVFPAQGSKINWRQVPTAIERIEEDQNRQAEQFAKFFDEMVATFCLAGDVVYVGDSATDFALAGSVERIRKRLPELFVVPQHHYFIGPNSCWCMCFTMEGDMGFGSSTVPPGWDILPHTPNETI